MPSTTTHTPTAKPVAPNRLALTAQPNPPDQNARTRQHNSSERGAVTAELAIALPVLLSLLLLGIWSIGLVILNIRCIDAARDVARAVARGEPPDQAKAIGHRTIPTGTITVSREGPDIRVTVTATPTHNPPLLSALAPTRLTALATLESEPTEDEFP